MKTAQIIQILTSAALVSLLLASGLRLRVDEVRQALANVPRLVRVLVVNFVVVPAVTLLAVGVAGVSSDRAAGILLLAAAPFAPVVPVFTRLARGDLALAAGLTGVFPLISAFVTPWVAAACQRWLGDVPAVHSDPVRNLVLLGLTITVPLGVGLGLSHRFPGWRQRWVRPVEMVAEAIGALSLAFVVAHEWTGLARAGWREWVAMILVFELSLAMGYAMGGPGMLGRRVIGLGTSNRNIALALLLAASSYGAGPALTAVVVNGLLMIVLGLLHTGWWALGSTRTRGGPGPVVPDER